MGAAAPSSQSGSSSGSGGDSSDAAKKQRPLLLSRSLGTAAGLSKLLPTGTTLAFQTMAPSFTRGGSCEDHDVNFAFTCGLIVFLTLLTAALNFTDSVAGDDGNTHYGVTTGARLKLFNDDRQLVRGPNPVVDRKKLRMMKLRPQDFLHALVSAAVFLALAFCDAGVQQCLGTRESQPWKDFFNHLPLAVGFLATFVFIVFPTIRKGIGEDGAWGGSPRSGSSESTQLADEAKKLTEKEEIPDDGGAGREKEVVEKPQQGKKAAAAPTTTTSLLASASTLSKLLPTGTTLAFQTMAPSFTNGGDCAGHHVNFAFTWGLIGVLTLTCAVLSFTDSVTDPDTGHALYGLATWTGIWLFNENPRHLRGRADWKRLLKEKRIRRRDFMHAGVSAAVFVALAFCDAGVQSCLVPKESTQWQEFLALLPLAVATLASFLFVIFPSDRNGIGEEGGGETKKGHEPKPQPAANTEAKVEKSSVQAMASMSITRVAPSSSEGDDDDGLQLHQLDSAV